MYVWASAMYRGKMVVLPYSIGVTFASLSIPWGQLGHSVPYCQLGASRSVTALWG